MVFKSIFLFYFSLRLKKFFLNSIKVKFINYKMKLKFFLVVMANKKLIYIRKFKRIINFC